MSQIRIGNTVLDYKDEKTLGFKPAPELDTGDLISMCRGGWFVKYNLREVECLEAQEAYNKGRSVLIAGVANLGYKLQQTSWTRQSKKGNEFGEKWGIIAPRYNQAQMWDGVLGNYPHAMYLRYFI